MTEHVPAPLCPECGQSENLEQYADMIEAEVARLTEENERLREALGWVEQWADSGNDNHLSLLLTVRAALAASREADRG
jgi:cell division septum initiation protein DivIVA